MTTSVVSYQSGATERPAQIVVIRHVVTADEDSANSITVTCSAVGTVKDVSSAQIRNTSDVHRAPQGAVTWTGNTITVVDSGAAVNEELLLIAIGYSE